MQKLNNKWIFLIFITINIFSNQFSEKMYVYDLGTRFETGYFQLAGRVLGNFEITENGVVNIQEKYSGDKIHNLVQKYKTDLFNELFNNMSEKDKDLITYSYELYFSQNLKILLSQKEKDYLQNKKSHNVTREYLNDRYEQIYKKKNIEKLLDLSEINNLDDEKFYVYRFFEDGSILKGFGEVYFNNKGIVEKEKIYKLLFAGQKIVEDIDVYQKYKNFSKRIKAKNCYFNFSEAKEREKYRLNVVSYKMYLFIEKNLLLLNEKETEELKKIRFSGNKEKEIDFVNKQRVFYLERQMNCNKIFMKDLH